MAQKWPRGETTLATCVAILTVDSPFGGKNCARDQKIPATFVQRAYKEEISNELCSGTSCNIGWIGLERAMENRSNLIYPPPACTFTFPLRMRSISTELCRHPSTFFSLMRNIQIIFHVLCEMFDDVGYAIYDERTKSLDRSPGHGHNFWWVRYSLKTLKYSQNIKHIRNIT